MTIEIRLDGRGGLRAPPAVLRNPDALLNEARLRSEAGALAAVAACLPRGSVAFANRTYRLDFPAQR